MTLTKQEVLAAQSADFFGVDWGKFEDGSREREMRLWPSAKVAQLRGVKLRECTLNADKVVGLNHENAQILLRAFADLRKAVCLDADRYCDVLAEREGDLMGELNPDDFPDTHDL